MMKRVGFVIGLSMCVAFLGGIAIHGVCEESLKSEVDQEATRFASCAFYEDECTHINAVRREAVTPTCTEHGKTEYVRCFDCGYVLYSEEIPALGHEMVEVEISANCVESGFVGSRCIRCDYRIGEELPVSGHLFAEVYEQPTCEKDGYAGKICTQCDFSVGEILIRTGHTEHPFEEVTPDCLHGGFTGGSYCEVCKKELTPRIELSPTEHRYLEETIEPDCNKNGKTIFTCEVCGDCREEEIAASGHLFQVLNKMEPTCIADGIEERACETCGLNEIEVIPKLGHIYGEKVQIKAPNCSESGIAIYSCERCSVICEEILSELGHAYGEAERKDATCTDGGFLMRICEICGDEWIEEVFPALGHMFDDWSETAVATCTDGGELKRMCGSCGLEEKVALPPLGHSWENWNEVLAATCSQEGERVRNCSVCAVIETEIVAALGHVFGEWQETAPATCTEEGVLTRFCISCREHTETRVLSAAGHMYFEIISAVAPTCTMDGATSGVRCRICHAWTKEPESISALGHAWGEGELVVRATYTQAGKRIFTCSSCNKSINVDIAKLEGQGTLFLEAVEQAKNAADDALLFKTEYAMKLYEKVEFPELVQEAYEILTALYMQAKGLHENKVTESKSSAVRVWGIILTTTGTGILCGMISVGGVRLIRKRRQKK